MKITSLIIFMIVCCNAYAQNSTCIDTLSWGDNHLVIDLPIDMKKTVSSHHGCSFLHYFSDEDSSSLVIILGTTNTNLPLLDTNSLSITGFTEIGNDLLLIRGYRGTKDSYPNVVTYFREDIYIAYSIAIHYTNASPEKRDQYNRVLDNIRIFKSSR